MSFLATTNSSVERPTAPQPHWILDSAVAPYIPSTIALSIIAFLGVVHYVAWSLGHTSVWVRTAENEPDMLTFVTPPISLTGNRIPAYFIYAFGCTFFAFAIFTYSETFRVVVKDQFLRRATAINLTGSLPPAEPSPPASNVCPQTPPSPPHTEDEHPAAFWRGHWRQAKSQDFTVVPDSPPVPVRPHSASCDPPSYDDCPPVNSAGSVQWPEAHIKKRRPVLSLGCCLLYLGLMGFAFQAIVPAQSDLLQTIGQQCYRITNASGLQFIKEDPDAVFEDPEDEIALMGLEDVRRLANEVRRLAHDDEEEDIQEGEVIKKVVRQVIRKKITREVITPPEEVEDLLDNNEALISDLTDIVKERLKGTQVDTEDAPNDTQPEPEPAHNEPEPAQNESEPAQNESEPAQNEPEPAPAPSPADAEPPASVDTVPSNPDTENPSLETTTAAPSEDSPAPAGDDGTQADAETPVESGENPSDGGEVPGEDDNAPAAADDGTADTPTGDNDTPDTPTGDGDTPSGDTPSGDTPTGDSDTPTNDSDTPDTPSGDGDTPTGDTFDTPSGDTPDTPSGDTSDTPDTPDTSDTPDTPSGDTSDTPGNPPMILNVDESTTTPSPKEDEDEDKKRHDLELEVEKQIDSMLSHARMELSHVTTTSTARRQVVDRPSLTRAQLIRTSTGLDHWTFLTDRILQSMTNRLQALLTEARPLAATEDRTDIAVDPSLIFCPEIKLAKVHWITLLHASGAMLFFLSIYLAMAIFGCWLAFKWLKRICKGICGCGNARYLLRPSSMSVFLKLLFTALPLLRPLEYVQPDILRHVSMLDFAGLSQRLSILCILLYGSTLGLEVQSLRQGMRLMEARRSS